MTKTNASQLRTLGAAGLCAALWLVAPIGASAEEESCTELARVISMNYSQSLDVDQQRSVNLADMCTEQYSSSNKTKAAQIEVGYKLFTGSASSSEGEVMAAQQKYCESKFGDFWRSKIQSSQARTVSSEALSVLDTCLKLKSDGLYTALTVTTDGDEFNISMQYKPALKTDPLTINNFGPVDLDANECSASKDGVFQRVKVAADVAQTLNQFGGISMTCKPKSSVTQIDGVEYDCTKEMIFGISTSSINKALKIPRKCKTRILPSTAQQLDNRVATLEARLNQVRDRQEEMITEFRGQPLFGGFYSKMDPCRVEANDSRLNPVTQDYKCPDGFTGYIVGRVRGSESNCGVEQYICFKVVQLK